jgi:hypothetical protein
MDAIADKPISVNYLIGEMERYADRQRTARDVDERWLCTLLTPVIAAAQQVRNSRLSEEHKKARDAFRAEEVEKEIVSKRREMQALESQLRQLRKPTPQ